MLTKLAIRYLTWRLRKEEDFYYAYQSNIAMAVYDAIKRKLSLDAEEMVTFHALCNQGAKDFLNLWINPRGA